METFRIVLYFLAMLTSHTWMVLLIRGYFQRGIRLLMWSAICFAGLTANNVLLFIDLVILPSTDLRPARLIAALGGMLFLLYGLIWEAE